MKLQNIQFIEGTKKEKLKGNALYDKDYAHTSQFGNSGLSFSSRSVTTIKDDVSRCQWWSIFISQPNASKIRSIHPPLVLLNGTRNTAYSLHFKFNLDIFRQLVITAFNLIYRHDNQKHLINHSFEKVSNRGEHANAKKVSWVMTFICSGCCLSHSPISAFKDEKFGQLIVDTMITRETNST